MSDRETERQIHTQKERGSCSSGIGRWCSFLLVFGIHELNSLLPWAGPRIWQVTLLNYIVFFKKCKWTAQVSSSLISLMYIVFDLSSSKLRMYLTALSYMHSTLTRVSSTCWSSHPETSLFQKWRVNWLTVGKKKTHATWISSVNMTEGFGGHRPWIISAELDTNHLKLQNRRPQSQTLLGSCHIP